MNSAIWACFQNPKQMVEADIVDFMTSLAPQTIYIPNSEADAEQYKIFPNLTPIEREVIVASKLDHPLLKGLEYPILIKRPDHSAIVDADLSAIGDDYLRLFEGTDGARRYKEKEAEYRDPQLAFEHYLKDAA
jgi:type IV secretory pathway VirB4 component